MNTVLIKERSWVSFDSGVTSFSRKHLEQLVLKRAKDLGLEIDYLVSFQLLNGMRRIAFAISAKDEVLLSQLATQLEREFPSFSGEHQLQELIEHCRSKESGRLIKFPISLDISSTVTASDLVSNSEIDEILAIGEELPADAVIRTSGYIRPIFNGGLTRLLVERVADGLFAPVESESPHECCGDHDEFVL